jgi:hypothetical protein
MGLGNKIVGSERRVRELTSGVAMPVLSIEQGRSALTSLVAGAAGVGQQGPIPRDGLESELRRQQDPVPRGALESALGSVSGGSPVHIKKD